MSYIQLIRRTSAVITISSIKMISANEMIVFLKYKTIKTSVRMIRKEGSWRLQRLEGGINGITKYAGYTAQHAWIRETQRLETIISSVLENPDVDAAIQRNDALGVMTAAQRALA